MYPLANVSASPAPKANDDLARATFYTDYAKVKNGSALGVRVYAMVMWFYFGLTNLGHWLYPIAGSFDL